jgi:diaminopimelate decarboxylase
MHHFHYRNGVLHAEDVDLERLAEQVGTPFYCYSSATLERHYGVFAAAFGDVRAMICYAMKANSNQAVIRTLAKLGAGADVVSGGEPGQIDVFGVQHAVAVVEMMHGYAFRTGRCSAPFAW